MIRFIIKLKDYIKYVLPSFVINMAKNIKYYKKRRELLDYYKDYSGNNEIIDAVNFIYTNGLHNYYPYKFPNNYSERKIIIHYDSEINLYYVLHKEKKLYFKEGMNKYGSILYYNSLLIEQDAESPHKYAYEGFCDMDNLVLFDIGSAEGIFGLELIEQINKLIIVEPDKTWVKALRATFKPWEHKVDIINRFVNSINDGDNITIDSLYSEYHNTKVNKALFKLDIEGMETIALSKARNTIIKDNVSWIVCTYHKPDDYKKITDDFTAHSYLTKPSSGYMVVLSDDFWEPPYMRKGVLFASKEQ